MPATYVSPFVSCLSVSIYVQFETKCSLSADDQARVCEKEPYYSHTSNVWWMQPRDQDVFCQWCVTCLD